jgi:hypothetical protein
MRSTRAPLTAAQARLVGRPARHPAVTRALAELRGFGVPTRLDFVWSGDGSGVELEAPRLIHLHHALIVADDAPAAVLDASDRVVAIDLLSVVRHEIGHALMFLDARRARSAAFRRLFGDIGRRYRVGNAIEEVLRRVERNRGLANPRYRRMVSLYAATHPHERFAEAVRIALALAGKPDAIDAWVVRHGTAPVVAEQIRWAADWLRTYRRR